MLDVLLLTVLWCVVALIDTGLIEAPHRLGLHTGSAGTIIWFVAALVYYLVFEVTTGQTIGKRALGIQVVTASGERSTPGIGRIAVRTVLRIIDALPALYLLGFILVLVTGKRSARLGDLVARTSVVSKADPAG